MEGGNYWTISLVTVLAFLEGVFNCDWNILTFVNAMLDARVGITVDFIIYLYLYLFILFYFS